MDNLSLWLNAEHAKRLDALQKNAGLNKSALFRRACADVPLEILIRAGVGPARSGFTKPGEMVRCQFHVDDYCRQRIAAFEAARFKPAELIRAALEPYLERSLEELQSLPDIFTTREQQRLAEMKADREEKASHMKPKSIPGNAAFTRGEIIRDAARSSIARDVEKWHGAPTAPKQRAPAPIPTAPPDLVEVTEAPPTPISVPRIDWSSAGPVQPRPNAASQLSAPGARMPIRPPLHSAVTSPKAPDPFEGLDLEEKEQGPAPVPSPPTVQAPAELDPLDLLRKKRNG